MDLWFLNANNLVLQESRSDSKDDNLVDASTEVFKRKSHLSLSYLNRFGGCGDFEANVVLTYHIGYKLVDLLEPLS